MDSDCAEIGKQFFIHLSSSLMPESLKKPNLNYEFWFGVKY